MSRPNQHPSGPARSISISLAPDHIGALDHLAHTRGISRSETVVQLIETAAAGTPVRRREGSQPSNESTTERSTGPGPTCPHPRLRQIGGGMWRCDDCDTTHRSRKDFS